MAAEVILEEIPKLNSVLILSISNQKMFWQVDRLTLPSVKENI